MKQLAFIALKTTGPNPLKDHVTEIAVARVGQDDLELRGMVDMYIEQPSVDVEHPKHSAPVNLVDGLARLTPFIERTVLAGHNVSRDKLFLEHLWDMLAIEPPEFDDHVLDLATLAWPMFAVGRIESLDLEDICIALDIERQTSRDALDRALRSVAVARCLLPSVRLSAALSELPADAMQVVQAVVGRHNADATGETPAAGTNKNLETLLSVVLDALGVGDRAAAA